MNEQRLNHTVASDPKAQQRMRIVLRNYQTGDFFQTANGWAEKRWTQKQSEASDFADHEAAIRMARELGLQNVEFCLLNAEGKPLLGTRIEIGP